MEKLKKKKLREEHGEDAVPKGEVKTIETMRVKDETYIDKEDDEVKEDEDIDEFAPYFKDGKPPKVIMTTCRRPDGVSSPPLTLIIETV